VAMTKCESGRERNERDGCHGETSAQVLLPSVRRCLRLTAADSTRSVDILRPTRTAEGKDADGDGGRMESYGEKICSI